LEARAARAPLRAVPEGPSRGSAYRQVASGLRQAIAAGRYATGQRLPTEAELVASTGLGRQTVRRAFQELVTEGVIYRVRGRGTFAVPELAGLAEPGSRARITMISLVDRVSDRRIDSAVQNATAVAASADIAHRLGCPQGLPVLRIDRLYRDRELAPLELAINHFHPGRYSYRLQLRGRLGSTSPDPGAR
jgi:DNA-binding GntR family transcriptional regulator